MAKVGRPSKYEERFCHEAEDFLAKGHSVQALCGLLSVAKSTLELWEKEHPEFSGAIKRGRNKAVLFWEEKLTKIADDNSGNVTAIIFGLKNRASGEWKDKVEQEHTGGLTVEIVRFGADDTPTE